MPKRLSQQEIERYQREGFLSPVRVLSLERAGKCLYARGLARPRGQAHPKPTIHRAAKHTGRWLAEPRQ
jgi:hypothetical protein